MCELVKLCHVNHSGPVFFETQCILRTQLYKASWVMTSITTRRINLNIPA